MDTSTINIAERVKDARRDAKLTQTELGKRIGKSKQWVSELERGNIKLSFEMAVSISNAWQNFLELNKRHCLRGNVVAAHR